MTIYHFSALLLAPLNHAAHAPLNEVKVQSHLVIVTLTENADQSVSFTQQLTFPLSYIPFDSAPR